MISSGIKRGLAASAVSALAVAGLPLLASSASAQPLADQLTAGAIVLHTPDAGGAASIKNDGVNQTVHLLANGGPLVSQVRFDYSTTGLADSWTTIATVSRSNGAFSTEWAPPVGVYNLDVHVRAVAIDSTNNDALTDDNIAKVTSNADAIDVSNAAGSAVGVFRQPYATFGAGGRPVAKTSDLGAVSATTSDVGTDPAVKFSTPYNATSNDEDVVGTPANGTRAVSGQADFTGYGWGTDVDADQAIVKTNVGGATGGSDAEAVTVYKQTITSVTAAAASPTVQGTLNTTKATVTVKDQNDKPVVGAEVVREGTNEIQYTNSKGEADFSGLTGTSTGTTYKFYVNSGDTFAYENGTDFERSVTVTSYSPAAASITPSSADGAAFDFDENDGNDIQALVKDQNGNPMADQVVRYAWTVTPFEATTGYPKTLDEASSTTGTDGKADIAFPTGQPDGTYKLHTYINQDGTPGQQSGDLGGTDLTVKAGDADIVWEDGSVAQAKSNTTKTFGGSLELADGTGLPGRDMSINLAQTNDANGDTVTGDNGDAIMAAQSAQPAGTTRLTATTAKTTSAADGSFAVALTDPPVVSPATPANEKGDVLTATTDDTLNIGDADDSSSLTVDFLKSVAPAVAGDITVNEQDLFGAVTPGRPVDLDITVHNADGDTLTDYPVTVSVNHGFLSPNAEDKADLTPEPAAAEGGLFGEWKDSGTSKEFTTDDSGKTGTVVAIEKDAAFDTSDTVTTTVTIKAGNVTTTLPVEFTTDYTPVNPGDVMVERAAASDQTVGILPKAPTAESVYYNVFATDQFGNLVPGQSIDLTDTLNHAYMNGDENNSSVDSQLKSDLPVLRLDSDVAGDQAVTGSWTADTRTWTDGEPLTAGFQPSVKLTSPGKTVKDTGETVNWYTIDFAQSTYTMTHDTANIVPVGTSVLMTYTAIDQNGEPINGVDVGFFRTGPDVYQDGDFNSGSTTGQDGKASYVFAGAKAGTATVQGLITDSSPIGGDQIVSESRATDSVKFAGPALQTIQALLGGSSNGAKADKLTVNAPSAAKGAKVKLFKIVNGMRKLVGTSYLNGSGDRTFTVADKNGNKKTTYVALVAKTSKTKSDATNNKTVR